MGVWYRTGTVAVTNGSKTVTGTNTQWANLMFGVMPGTTFYGPDGKPYEIDRVVSDTSLLLISNYGGATASGQAYAIDPTRSGSVSSLAAQASEVLKFSQEQFTQMQMWVTGAANVDVTLKAPSGQTITVPSWKKISDTVSGQAAIAKQEADKAAASAALAGSAVAASAMPFPDLMAPLVNDLKLITGYGTDVMSVGSDTLRIPGLSQFNFERLSSATERQKDGKLRLVPAGQPRYEGGALVKERGSTNLYFPHDGTSGCSAVRGSVVTSAGSGLLGETSTVKYVEDSTDGSHYLWCKPISGFNVGEEVSISVELVPLKAGLTAVQLGCNTFTDVKVNLNLSPSDLGKPIVITHKSTVTGTSVQPYVWPVLGGNMNWQGDGSTVFELLSVQVEKGPPTSLIPTTTAAATRAAESVWLPGPANSPGYGKSRTYAFEFEVISPSTSGYITFICDGAYPTRTFLGIWSDGQLQVSNDYVKAYATQYTLKKRNVISASFDYDGGYVMFSLNGGPIVKSSVPCAIKPGLAEVPYERLEIGTLGNGGHQCSVRIRNFRQWNRASSESQLLAIR